MGYGALIGGALGLVGSVVGSTIQSGAAQSAANTQAKAAQSANATQLAIYNQNRADLAPWRNTGTNALYQMAQIYGIPTPPGPGGTPASAGGQPAINNALTNFKNSPDYQFAFNQGLQATDQSAAARGLLLSGGQLKDLTQYGQGMASQQFGNYWNRLAGLAGVGQTATNTGVNVAQNFAGAYGTNQLLAAQARASGIVGSANAVTGGINNGLTQLNLARGGYGGYGAGNQYGVTLGTRFNNLLAGGGFGASGFNAGGIGGSNVTGYGAPTGFPGFGGYGSFLRSSN